MILARPEITGATAVIAPITAARRCSRRCIARVPVAHTTMTALDSQIASDLGAGDIADYATSDQTNRTCDYGTRDSP